MNHREVIKQALRALEDYKKHTAGVMIPQTRVQGDEAIAALYAAIEQPEQDWEAVAADQAMTIALLKSDQQPEQEPVAVVAMDISGLHMCYGGEYIGQKPDTKIAMMFKDLPLGTRLFTAPSQHKPLSDDQIIAAIKNISYNEMSAFNIARAIEKAHGIGVKE